MNLKKILEEEKFKFPNNSEKQFYELEKKLYDCFKDNNKSCKECLKMIDGIGNDKYQRDMEKECKEYKN